MLRVRAAGGEELLVNVLLVSEELRKPGGPGPHVSGRPTTLTRPRKWDSIGQTPAADSLITAGLPLYQAPQPDN